MNLLTKTAMASIVRAKNYAISMALFWLFLPLALVLAIGRFVHFKTPVLRTRKSKSLVPPDPFVRPGFVEVFEDALQAVSAPSMTLAGPDTVFEFCDKTTTTARNAMEDMLSKAIHAASSTANWRSLGSKHGVAFEYDRERWRSGDGNRRFRLKAHLPDVSPKMLAGILLDPHALGEIDPTTCLLRTLAVLEATPVGGMHLTQAVAVPGFPLRLRDFVDLGGWRVLDDGAVVMVARSCPSAAPAMPNSVLRGHVLEWGYVFAPDASRTGTQLTLVSQSDLCGWAPTAMINRLTAPVLADYVKRLEAAALEAVSRGQAAAVEARTTPGVSSSSSSRAARRTMSPSAARR